MTRLNFDIEFKQAAALENGQAICTWHQISGLYFLVLQLDTRCFVPTVNRKTKHYNFDQ